MSKKTIKVDQEKNDNKPEKPLFTYIYFLKNGTYECDTPLPVDIVRPIPGLNSSFEVIEPMIRINYPGKFKVHDMKSEFPCTKEELEKWRKKKYININTNIICPIFLHLSFFF